MFEKIHEHLKKKEANKTTETIIPVSLSQNPSFDLNILVQRGKDIDNIEERELFTILKKSFRLLLENIFINKDSEAIMLFFNSKFLNVFIQVIGTETLTSEEILYCNTIVYDYLTDQNIEKDEFTKTLFLTLGRNVNRQKVYQLTALGIDEPLAIKMAVSRHSTKKETVNVARLNLIMICSSPDIFTPQMIIYVYEIFFDFLAPLFIGTMYDVYTDDELEAISDGAADIYSNIGLAVIDILNSMPSDLMRKVLLTYAQEYGTSEKRSRIRFTINSISMSEYFRIYAVVEALKLEGVFVP